LNRNQRNSNLEILRIVAMFFIIAHHFAVHGMGNIDFVASNPNNYIIFFCGILGNRNRGLCSDFGLLYD